jgi:hypothetical protein
MVYSNSNNIINNVQTKDDVLNHPFIMMGLLFAFLFVVIYVIYKYAVTNSPVQGYTYYANDILKLDPLFTETLTNIDDCVDMCKNQINCDGITYDNNTNVCIGQKEGRLRTDDDNLYAWVKKKGTSSLILKGEIKDFQETKILINSIKSNNSLAIPSKNISNPPFIDSFSYSFVIKIEDWYENYSFWRHILHKGSPPDKSSNNKMKKLEYPKWEQIMVDLPEQTLGFWLSPFQNNLRVAVTTLSKIPKSKNYEHANIEKCKCEVINTDITNQNQPRVHCSNCWITDQEDDMDRRTESIIDTKDFQTMDYVDIQDLQTNVPIHIAVSIKGAIIEVYVNGVFKVSKVLNGVPKWNNGDLYIHNPLTYKGILNNLSVIPGTINGEIVKKIYNEFVINNQ